MVGFRFLAGVAAAAVTAATFSVSAHAAVFGFSIYNSSSALLASGTLTTSNTLNTLGGYDVLSIAGQVNGYGAITGLMPTIAPATPTNANGFIINNVVYSNTSLAVDYYGIGFTTAAPAGGTAYWNVFHDAGTTQLYGNLPVTGYVANPNASITVAAIPEPETWALAFAGFGLIGVSMRNRRKPSVRVRLNLA